MLEQVAQQAKSASYELNIATTTSKNKALLTIASMLKENSQPILEENSKDIILAKQNNISEAMLDRLLLTEARLQQIIDDIYNVVDLSDPIGEIIETRNLPSGLLLEKKRVPLGVIAAIYEARPNVTIDIATLCIKTGNAVILRGGKETTYTNIKLIELIQQALLKADLPLHSVQYLNDPDRRYLQPLLKLDKYVDMIVPRGGTTLQRLCQEHATIPVILGGIGVCHIFVDKSADLKKALTIIENAKIQRPSTCNSVETVLIHQEIASEFLPMLLNHLRDKGVKCHLRSEQLKNLSSALLTQYSDNLCILEEEQLYQEWLSLNLNIIVIDNLTDAISHIRHYGSAHSDAILTASEANANLFISQVDSAAVYINCSTRFTDGAQFGLGAEVAISTQKLHARGPLGLEALTTYKWIGKGHYLIRE